MKNLIIGFVAGIIVMASLSFATSKKEIIDLRISSKTTTETYFKDGEEKTYKESFTSFDKAGNTIEDIEYKKDGTIKSKETSKYNSFGDKTEEKIFKAKDGTTTRTTFSYDANGRKTGEVEYDENGSVKKKSSFSYDKKGFRTEKKVLNSEGKVISVEKYSYTTY